MSVSTAKADWPRAVTEVDGSLAKHISDQFTKLVGDPSRKEADTAPLPGLFPSSVQQPAEARSSRITILNGSNWSDSASESSVLVFPDYKIAHAIKSTTEHAQVFVKGHLAPQLDRFSASTSASPIHSFPLPYREQTSNEVSTE